MQRSRMASVGLFLLTCGCGFYSPSAARTPSETPAAASAVGSYDDVDSGYGTPGLITFLDHAPANTSVEQGLSGLSFTRPDGSIVGLHDIAGDRTTVLVITRGNTGSICPYCSTQTARLISAYDQFAERGAEVVLVYPVEAAADSVRLDEFLAAVRRQLNDPNRPVPFPVVLDVQLQAIDQLGIRRNLSKPATYIVDRTGEVRYAYVGEHLADRPSVEAVLKQLDQIGGVAVESASTRSGESVGTTAMASHRRRD